MITDPAELHNLPDRTAILDALGVPRQLIDNLWVGTTPSSIFLYDLRDHPGSAPTSRSPGFWVGTSRPGNRCPAAVLTDPPGLATPEGAI